MLIKFLSSLDSKILLLSVLSILPWAFFLFVLQPSSNGRKFFISFCAFGLGILSTQFILYLHPILWPEVNFKPKKATSMLSQTVYISFIQAGMMEETFKESFILFLSLVTGFDFKEKKFHKDVILIGAFVALGFACVENYVYIAKDNIKIVDMFLGRTFYSSNIHLLINLCFALFLLKTNTSSEKLILILYGYFLAVMQHGIVDFFLLPGSRFGNWLSTAFFVGIWVWVVRDLRKYVYTEETTDLQAESIL